MDLIVDANILFAALIKDSTTRRILITSSHSFYCPEFSISEFIKHLPELSKKTGLGKDELEIIIDRIIETAGITMIPFEEFIHKQAEAESISPDPDDVAYFALALHMECAIWSNDKRLIDQKKIRIMTTKEIISL